MKALLLVICFCIAFVSVGFGQSASKTRKKRSSTTAAKTPAKHVPRGRQVVECYAATVKDLTLSHYEVSRDSAKTINVATDAFDNEGDVLVYRYSVSAGTITGTGPNVAWDLTGVNPGTYTITAAVDDGCGFCGPTKTKIVRVID